jgi:hypothetical protein
MPAVVWILSIDASRVRLLYETNGTSDYQVYGGDYGDAHQWKNRHASWIMSLNDLLKYYRSNQLSQNNEKWSKSGVDIAGPAGFYGINQQ